MTEINEVNYNLEITGSGKPLLLLHGFTGSLRTWDFFAENLAKEHTLIAVDILGHGKSQKPDDTTRYEIEKIAADLKDILVSLDISKTSILGYSMGGRLALSFAILYPEYLECLILESSSPGLEQLEDRMQRRKEDQNLADFIEERGLEGFVEYWSKLPLFREEKLSQESRGRLRKQRMDNSVMGLRNSLIGMGTGSQPSWWGRLCEIDTPVLLVVGAEDNKFVQIARKMKSSIRNCELAEVLKTGHVVHMEKPKEFVRIVGEYLNSGNSKGEDL